MTERRGPLSRFLFKEYQQFLLELATMREERRLTDRLLQVIDLGEKAVVNVLSGGGALALMHIGVLVAIREAGIPVHAVVGNSAGAIGTVIYSEAQSYNAILHAVIIGISVRWRDLARIGNPTAGGMVNFSLLESFIEKNRRAIQAENEETVTPIPFIITATDITSLRRPTVKIFTDELEAPLGRIVQASSAVPGIIPPVKIGKGYYRDGMIFPPVDEPVDIARALFPKALLVSVRITGSSIFPLNSPDVRITPRRKNGHPLFNAAFFNPKDVQIGYQAGLTAVAEILDHISQRGIDRSFLPGFPPQVELGQLF